MAIKWEGHTIKPDERMKRVKSPYEVPEEPHYAVIVYNQERVTIPGDERSRTNPGHGYPEHTRTFDTFEHWVTTNIDDLGKFLEWLESEHKSFAFMKVEAKGSVKKSISFQLTPSEIFTAKE